MTLSASIRPDPAPHEAIAAARQRRIGILLMCGALACFSGLDASGKWLNVHIPILQVVWARYFGSAVFVFLAVNPMTTKGIFATQRLGLQLVRSTLLLLSTALNFLALQHLQLAETMSITFAMPLVIALLAGPMLGEWVGPRRLVAIFVGFGGVLVVTRPGLGAMHPAALWSVLGIFCYSFYNILTRMLSATENPRTTLVYSSLPGVIMLTPLMPFVWVWPDSLWVWLGMGLIGLCGAFGHWLLIRAHDRAPAAILAPFVYTEMIWMIILGYLVFGDVPGIWTLVGGAIVIGSGIYLWYRERVVIAK